MLKKLLLALVSPVCRFFRLTQILYDSGSRDLSDKRYVLGLGKMYLSSVMLVVIPVWFAGLLVMAPFILIHFGWMALVGYLICKFTGVCPI